MQDNADVKILLPIVLAAALGISGPIGTLLDRSNGKPASSGSLLLGYYTDDGRLHYLDVPPPA